jgi:hypothetical protein
VPRAWPTRRALGDGLENASANLIDDPETNPTGASERRYAVAIHEAGHAITFAAVGIDVLRIWICPGPNPSGDARSGEINAASRPEFLATLYASDIAVEELCGGYRLPLDTSPGSDQEQLRRAEARLEIKNQERSEAQTLARKIVRFWSAQLVALANALLATPDGQLVGANLDQQLASVRRQCTE